MSKQAKKVSKLVRTAPERIFLQIADEDYSRESFPRPYGEEITWCETSCVECEVEYVRADLADEQRAELLEAFSLIALDARQDADEDDATIFFKGDGSYREVVQEAFKWNGIPVLVTGRVWTHDANWPLIDEAADSK